MNDSEVQPGALLPEPDTAPEAAPAPKTQPTSEDGAAAPLKPESASSSAPHILGAAGGCSENALRIIQKICTPADPTGAAAIAFENNMVADWLAAHGLPASDAGKVYQLGRPDLRAELRDYMFMRLQKMGQDNTSIDPFFVNFRQLMWTREKIYWQAADDDMRLFTTNVCAWTLDPDIAAQYKLTIDTAPWCKDSNLTTLFQGITIPTKDYFTSVALYTVYEKKQTVDRGAGAVLAEAGMGILSMLGVDDLVGVGVGVAGGTAIGVNVAKILPNMSRAVARAGKKLIQKTFDVVSKISKFEAAAGPAAIIGIAIDVGIKAGEQAIENDQNFADIKTLDGDLARINNYPVAPSLSGLIDDPLGYQKIKDTFMDMTMRFEEPISTVEWSNNAPLPPLPQNPLIFQLTHGTSVTQSNQMHWIDWVGTKWSGYLVDGWMVASGTDTHGDPATSYFPGIKFQTVDGKVYLASILGRHFVVTRDPDDTGATCAADSLLGVTAPAVIPGCHAYVAADVMLKDWDGSTVNVAIPNTPSFTAARESVSFFNGSAANADFNATGFPVPTITMVAGSLPPSVTFFDSSTRGVGQARLTFSGSGGDDTRTITLRATGGNVSVDQNVTIAVRHSPAITSANQMTIKTGVPARFTVTSSGSLPIHLAVDDGALVPGLTFQDSGFGFGTISGTYDGTQTTPLCIRLDGAPCGVTATPGIGNPVHQSFKVNITPAPAPTQPTGFTHDFIQGIPNDVRLASAGALTRVFYAMPGGCSHQPSWLAFTDNGDGTATMSGTPPIAATVTDTPVFIDFWASGDGSRVNFNGTNFPQCVSFSGPPQPNHTLHTLLTPRFTGDNFGTMSAGQAGSVTVGINQLFGPTVSVTGFGALPAGVTFGGVSGPNVVRFFGTPAAGSGGEWPYQITVRNTTTNPVTEATLNFTLQVNETVKILAPEPVNILRNANATIRINTSGYPTAANLTLTAGGSALPGTLVFTPDPNGTSATISGNAGNTIRPFIFSLHAQNGPFPLQSKRLTIYVVDPGDANSDFTVSCADISFVRSQFGKRTGSPAFDSRADIDGNGIVDTRDVVLVTRQVNQAGGGPCN